MANGLYLIVNPAARRGRSKRRIDQLVGAFRDAGLRPELLESESPGDIEAKVRAAAEDGAERVIVAGGDGTVHEAANGLMTASQRPALGVIPTGSGNDFAKACGIDLDWVIATRTLAGRIADGAEPRPLDVGRCNERHFTNGVGIGFDAIVTRYAHEVRAPIGDLVYLVGLARAMLKGIATPELSVDSAELRYDGKATLANIANGPWLGGRFLIAPAADNADGRLNLVIAESVTRRRILQLLPSLMRGEHLDAPEVRHASIDRVVVTAECPTPSHVDGEVMPLATRFEIECLPGALRLL